MSTQANILVVVDPTQDEQPALARALYACRTHSPQPRLHLFFGIDGQAVDTSASNPQMYRQLDWYLGLVEKLEANDIEYSSEICWSPDWSRSVVHSAKEIDADLIMVSDASTSHSRLKLTDTKWDLLRHAKCPVLLARTTEHPSKVVLAAVKVQSDSSEYVSLNEKLLHRGKWIADLDGGEFHVVNSYTDSMHYPDRAKILRAVDLPPENIHIKQGPADEVVANVAREINAGIVVIGTLKRTGLLAAMRGNTSELLMSKVTCDIMTLN